MMDPQEKVKDPNCNEAINNLPSKIFNQTAPTVMNLCSSDSLGIYQHELVSANSIDFNTGTSLSDDSGVPLTTNSSISSNDSYRMGICKFETELTESDGEVSQFDSLDNCSEGGMSAENFNTLKKGPLAPIDPPPEFQDSPHTTLGRSMSKNILNTLTRWSSSQSFEQIKDTEIVLPNIVVEVENNSTNLKDKPIIESYSVTHLYCSDFLLNNCRDNIYDEPNDVIRASLGNNIDILEGDISSVKGINTLCPHFQDHTRYFKAIPSEQDNTTAQMQLQTFILPGLSDVQDYDLYYGLKRNLNAHQCDNSLQRKLLYSPLHNHASYHHQQHNHHHYSHYHTGSTGGNRPNSRNSLNSRLSSSHNSLSVSSANKADDSIFITQAMSHDALITREISDFYNVPMDSDIYAFPIDMIRPDNTKDVTSIHKSKDIDNKHQKSNRHKYTRNNKRRKRNNNANNNNNSCTDENIFGADKQENKKKHNYKTVAVSVAWNSSDNEKCHGDKCQIVPECSIEPLHMTLDEVKQFYHTLYSDTKDGVGTSSAVSGVLTATTSTTNKLSLNVKSTNEMVLEIASRAKSVNKNTATTMPIKTNNSASIKNTKLVTDKNDSINNNNSTNNHNIHLQHNLLLQPEARQLQQQNLQLQHHSHHANNKLTLHTEKKSQFTLNLKQKFCSIFRFRKNHSSRCRTNSTDSSEYISNRDQPTNRLQSADEKRKKFQSRALPPLPKRSDADPIPTTLESDEKEIKKAEFRSIHFTSSIEKVKDYGWYWGPLSSEAAEKVLSNEPDGSFIVRDSSDDHYIFSLSFKLNNCVRHVRIEQDQGTFSFGSYAKFKSQTITEFIEKAVEHSRSGRYLFFLHRRPEHGPMRVQLTNPVSRFKHIQSLQHMCRFVILKAVVRNDLIQTLPLPRRLLDYLKYKHCYSEQVESDSSQSQMSGDGQD